MTVTDKELKALPLAGSVTVKPGLSPVKFESKKDVYAVAHGGILRKINTPALAAMIFGKDWIAKTVVLPKTAFAAYKLGKNITGAGQYWWKQEMDKSSDISADHGLPPPVAATASVPVKTETPAATPPASDFRITAVFVLNFDANERSVVDSRRFDISFSDPAKNVKLVITEKTTNKVFVTKEFANDSPLKKDFSYFTEKLQPNTAYAWTLTGNDAAAPAAAPVSRSDEFTTSNFDAAVASGFRVVRVTYSEHDADYNYAPEYRRFGAEFSSPVKDATLTIAEKASGTEVYSGPMKHLGTSPQDDGSSIGIANDNPGDWKNKLKPSTAYVWKVSGHPESGSGTATAAGEFSTDAFDAANLPVFKIADVVVSKYSPGFMGSGEDARAFTISFSGDAAEKVKLKIAEKSTGAVFQSVSVNNDAKIIDKTVVLPTGWPAKLKQDTTYVWTVSAIAVVPIVYDDTMAGGRILTGDGAGQTATASGEFTTAKSF